MILLQAPQASRDKELIVACTKAGGETDGQRSWLQTRGLSRPRAKHS